MELHDLVIGLVLQNVLAGPLVDCPPCRPCCTGTHAAGAARGPRRFPVVRKGALDFPQEKTTCLSTLTRRPPECTTDSRTRDAHR